MIFFNMRKSIAISLDETTIKSIDKNRGLNTVSRFIEHILVNNFEIKENGVRSPFSQGKKSPSQLKRGRVLQ